MLWWTIQNSLVIAALALAIVAMSRAARLRPSIEHALWLVLFIKFLTPPVVEWPWSLGQLIAERKRETTAVSDVQRSVGEIPPVPGDQSTEEVAELISGLLIDPQSPLEGIPANDSSRAADLPHFPKPDAVISTSGATSPRIVFAIWLTGAIGVALTRICRIQRVRRLVREARSAPAWLVDDLIGLSKSLGVRAPNALCTPEVNSPCLWCFGRPVLLWPEHLSDAGCRDAWRGVVVHELAHLRRRDHWVTWLELFAGCVWWFNPVFWFVGRRLYASAELACDAWVVAAAPGGVRAYAESLVEVTRRVAQTARSASLPSPALGASSGARRSLERRLTMILSQPRPYRISRVGFLGSCLLAIFALPAWSLDGPAVEEAAPPRPANAADNLPVGLPAPPAQATDPATAAPIGAPAIADSADSDRIKKLERRIEALMNEIQGLREARSRAAGRSTATPASPLRALAPDGKVIAVISDDGQVTSTAHGGVQLDLVRLATEYSDALGNKKLAERLFELIQKAHSSGEATQKDAITAEINLVNARQKLGLLKTIAEAASAAAKAELSSAEKRHAVGQANESESAQARAKLEILMHILRSN